MSTLTKIIIITLISILAYFIYDRIMLTRQINKLKDDAIQKETTEIINRKTLIDSIIKSKIVITQELLQNKNNINKLKDELKKSSTDSITLEQAKQILNL